MSKKYLRLLSTLLTIIMVGSIIFASIGCSKKEATSVDGTKEVTLTFFICLLRAFYYYLLEY